MTDQHIPADLNKPRWIERGDFPLRETSLDSVHEKNVRHGHISTLHIWPARRPLAACRAALIATLLPAPEDEAERRRWKEMLGGKIVKGKDKDTTEGGILHWGRENDEGLEYFRQKIYAAYGRAPRVLDPFAGGGAIPLEAMRLGCDVTAADLNPVAWFILKCTLEYPQKLAGQKRPFPDFARQDPIFMEAFLKAQGLKGRALTQELTRLGLGQDPDQPITGLEPALTPLDADFAWHVRAWGQWVLARARKDLGRFYPMVNDQPTVAYLWARTVPCKNCRAELPLLKTRWLCKKEKKRILLQMTPNPETRRMDFDIQINVPEGMGASKEMRREHDKKIGAGTMSKPGATCPFCQTLNEMRDLRAAGKAGNLGARMTAVVVDVPYKKGDKAAGEARGKAYRLPTNEELQVAEEAASELPRVFADIPFGLPDELVPVGSSRAGGGSAFTAPLYGLETWQDLFTSRQLLALGTFVNTTRGVHQEMCARGYSQEWAEGVCAYLAAGIDKMADYSSTVTHWQPKGEFVVNTFQRFALPISWDFSEANNTSDQTGSYSNILEWIGRVAAHTLLGASSCVEAKAITQSATKIPIGVFDVIVTDPPYYDAIPYSDLMDFFYVWLRRSLYGLSREFDHAFSRSISPKWDHDADDGEAIDDASRFGGDKVKSKANYERTMARAFEACHSALTPEGRLVIVFAHKHPDAWETLVTAIIKAGFIVDASWPIQTEMGNRTRAQASAALSSSVWLVCKKRPASARPGWDNIVLEQMREKIAVRLKEYWESGIQGPDFVWAATGPALESYSRHPIVKKANEPGQLLEVGEFLRVVRRMVLDFAVSRALHMDPQAADELDDVTTYYLLHRHDFGLEDAPAGACILYAVSCNLKESDLVEQDLLVRSGKATVPSEDEEDTDNPDNAGSDDDGAGAGGSLMRLKAWNRRTRPTMGYDPLLDRYRAQQKAAGPSLFDDSDTPTPTGTEPRGRGIPLIDQAHRLMNLWKTSQSEGAVNEYIDMRGLRRNALFGQVLQALIELAPEGSEERALLERIQNQVARAAAQPAMAF